MTDGEKPKLRLEIAHVLFIDIVGYSKLLIDEQTEGLKALNTVVLNTEAVLEAEAANQLIRLPTGDGMALVFTSSVEAPVECALQIAQRLWQTTPLPVRMGIHTGPVHQLEDVNQRTNIAGAGINVAQRVMDCGDAGHILLSQRAADDLGHYGRWHSYFHEIGECEVKHGFRLSLVNLYTEKLGNPTVPQKLKKRKIAGISMSRPSVRVAVVGAVLLALIATATWFVFQRREQTSATAAAVVPEKSVAILPFRPLSAETRDETLENGMADTLIAKLSTIAHIIIPSLSSAQKYAEQENDPIAAGRLLHVRTVLEGTLQKASDRIRVTARLINVADGASLWSDTFDEKFTDVFAVEDTIAQKVAAALAVRLTGEEQKRLTKRYTGNTEAYQLYLKGRFQWNKYTEEGWRKSIEFFKQAAEKDPNYGLAYSGMADSYSLLGEVSFLTPKEAFENARTYAEQALKLDESLSEAHLSLGIVKLFYDWDVAAAAKELLRAKELDPHNVQVYHFNGHRLEFESRFDDAIAEFKRGVEIDPTNLIINTEFANAYYLARQFDAAITQCRKTLELDPGFEIAIVWIAQAYEQKRMYQEALTELKKLGPSGDTSPFVLAEVGSSEAGLGHRAEAEKIIKKLQERLAHEYVDPTLIAYIYIVLGDRDQAFGWLERGFQERAGNIPWMKIEPKYDPLRGDPRLTDLLRRIGI